MPTFVYQGDDERSFFHAGTVSPGDTWEGDENPDPSRWDELDADGNVVEAGPSDTEPDADTDDPVATDHSTEAQPDPDVAAESETEGA